MCNTLVNTCVFVFHSVLDLYKTQEMWERVVSEDSFMIIYCPYKYKTQNMYVEAVDDCLAALRFIPGCFVTSFMMLYSLMIICFFDKDFNKVTFFGEEIGIYFQFRFW